MSQFFTFLFSHWILAFALIFFTALLIFGEAKRKLLGFKDLGINDALRYINHEHAVVVDVREDKEFNEGHILNAVHLPLGVLEARHAELDAYKDKPVIVCCRTGERALRGAAILKKQGFTQIFKLDGGMLAWKAANLPTAK